MLSDLRLAWRGLTAQPALALTALATFAVGIGATTAMHSVVDGVLLRPLPYRQPDRIVRLWEVHPGAPVTFQQHWLSNVTLDAWKSRARSVAAFARYTQETDTVGRDRPERLISGLVVGLAGAAALSRLMETALFGVTPLDPWSYAVAPALLLVVAAAACLLPARRASSVAPAEALRCE